MLHKVRCRPNERELATRYNEYSISCTVRSRWNESVRSRSFALVRLQVWIRLKINDARSLFLARHGWSHFRFFRCPVAHPNQFRCLSSFELAATTAAILSTTREERLLSPGRSLSYRAAGSTKVMQVARYTHFVFPLTLPTCLKLRARRDILVVNKDDLSEEDRDRAAIPSMSVPKIIDTSPPYSSLMRSSLL